MREIILINVSGPDKPGVTSRVAEILSRYNVNILDIGQAVIHDTLTLGMVVDVPQDAESSPVLKDVLFCCHALEMNVRFSIIEPDQYEEWVKAQSRNLYIITLLARKITSAQIAAIASVVAEHGLNIDNMNRLSGRVSLREDRVDQKACVEFAVRGEPRDLDAMRGQFMEVASQHGVDIAFQRDT